jgi:hypothetical protein
MACSKFSAHGSVKFKNNAQSLPKRTHSKAQLCYAVREIFTVG